MVQVTRTFTANVPPAVAVDYLADFGNAEEWDPGTVSCTRLDHGPVVPGARWQNVSKILHRETALTYVLVQKRPDGVVLEGSNKTARSVDDIRVVGTPAGSRVTYNATIHFHGLAKLADPFMRLVFERLAGRTAGQMAHALEQHAHQRRR